MGLVALQLCYSTGNQATKDSLKLQLQSDSLLKNIGYNYSLAYFALFSHESGHATAAKLLTGNDCTIHLGSHDDEATPLFSSQSVFIDGLDPYAGYTTNCFSEDSSKLASIIISAAGSIGAITTNLALHKCRDLINSSEPSMTPPLLENSIVLAQFLNILLPYGPHSDAANLYRELGIPEDFIKALSFLFLPTAISGQYYLINKKIVPGIHHETRSKFLLACANLFLLGTAEFHL